MSLEDSTVLYGIIMISKFTRAIFIKQSQQDGVTVWVSFVRVFIDVDYVFYWIY